MEGNVSISPWRLLSSVLVSDEETRTEKLLAFRRNLDSFFQNTLQADILFKRFYRDRMLVLANECVFPDVRQVFRDELSYRYVDLTSYKQPITTYWQIQFPPEGLSPSGEQLRCKIQEELFVTYGRVTNYEKLQSYYPQYMQHLLTLNNHLFDRSGALEISWRNYAAFMAAAATNNGYIMKLVEDCLQGLGGDISFFYQEGLANLPEKIKMLGQLNVVLAHQPWEFDSEMLRKPLEDEWQLEELIHSLVIMVSYHSLSCFTFALGVADEFDLPLTTEHREREQELRRNQLAEEVMTSTQTSVIAKLRNYEDEIQKISEDIDPLLIEEAKVANAEYFTQFAGAEMTYLNYDKVMQRKTIYPTTFSWQGHGDEILERVLPETGNLITDLLTHSKSMTNNKVGTVENIQTEHLRNAIWYYTQRLFGIIYEYYNYADVNLFLNIETKTYVKKVACYPWAVTKKDFKAAQKWMGLTPEEMIHVAALISEAKRETEMLYLVKALKAHLDSFR